MKKILARLGLFVGLVTILSGAAVWLLSDVREGSGVILLVLSSYALVCALLGTWLVLPPFVEYFRSNMAAPDPREDMFP